MTLYRSFLWFWIGGLVLFAIVIILSLPLGIAAVPGGIGDHQAAGSAAEVNRIHNAWANAGLLSQARVAMIGDLVFIGVYGVGSLLGGLWLRKTGSGAARLGGVIIALAAAIFLVTDYTETIAEFIQLTRYTGDEGLASLAAAVRPAKMLAWLVTFFGISAALLVRRFASRGT